MEIVEIEREMWRIAQLRAKILIVEEQVLFLEALIRDYIDRKSNPSMITEVLRECCALLSDLGNQRDAADQRIRACVAQSAYSRSRNNKSANH